MSSSANNNNFLKPLYIDPEVLRMLVTCTGILVSKMLLTNFYSAIPSNLSGFGPPEDSWLLKHIFGVEQTHGVAAAGSNKVIDTKGTGSRIEENKKKSRAMIRAQRIVMNDLENIPISLIAFWMAAIATASSTSNKSHEEIMWLVQAFTLARVAHTVTYYMGITVVRSVVFIVGYLSVIRALYLTW